MGFRASVAGASGYAGGELLRLLLDHPQLELGALAAGGSAGQPVTAVHPHLPQLASTTFTAADPGVLADADVVFLALPHGQSAALAAQLPDGVLIVDLGADHRLTDAAAWDRYYGGPHAGTWTYGLPELPGARAAIAASRRIAASGCYAVAITLALAPLIAVGIADPEDVVVVAASGTSGAGRAAKTHLLGAETMGDLTPYKVGAHQHVPEIKQVTGARTLSFTPVLAPMPRGILATVTAKPARPGVREADVRAVLTTAYGSEPFVHVLAPGTWPHTSATYGSNSAHLQAAVDMDSGRVIVVSAIDNLGKGAAGQALQCANIALGLEETAGLPVAGGGAMTVTTPKGFRAAGATAGLKASGRPDVALVVNDGPAHHGAGVFTANRVQAAPVVWSRQVVADGRIDAVVLNSGGANACTGPTGFQNTHATAERVATTLGLSATDVAVCSTGLIGTQLPMDLLLPGVAAAAAALGGDEQHGHDAATAIMTTDTVTKTVIGTGDGWSIGAMAKGAAMLAPGLATMLVVLTTDADVVPDALDGALREACRTTFERVDSDGCMSTNDTVLLLASAASGRSPTPAEFQDVLTGVCADLARQLLADAEGAAHDIAVAVTGAATATDAVEVARAVARSNLFKCAVFGRDPNWGRVLAAVGTTTAAFDPQTLDVTMNGVAVCRDGAVGDDPAKVDLTGRDVDVLIDLKAGPVTATVWTSDLTHDYVHENSAYST